jgi:predicted O-methyltransferase YrrM
MGKSHADWFPDETDLDWIESLGGDVHPALAAIEADAQPDAEGQPHGVPIIDRASGRVLAALAADRRRIVEIGTAIGYSTLWMALAQPADGTIVTVDPDVGRTARARGHWRAAGLADERIIVINAAALVALGAAGTAKAGGAAAAPGPAAARDPAAAPGPAAARDPAAAPGPAAVRDPRLDGPFDLAFIDAVKEEYLAYLEALVPRLAAGAHVVADNVLWSGRTSGSRPGGDGDPRTEGLRVFCATVIADPRFVGTILPVGDGLLVATFRGTDRAGGGR